MDEKEIRRMMEEEYTETLKDITNIAMDEEQHKKAMAKLELLHKQIMDERKLEEESRQKALDRELKVHQGAGEEILREKELEEKHTQAAMDWEQKNKELELKEQELKSENRNRVVGWILAGATTVTTVVSMVLTNKWLKQTMSFEETGTFTSKSGRFVSDIKRLFGKG